MTHEQHLALDLIARLANRFGPASRIAKELPGWLEYLTEVECPERPRTRPSTQWWNKIRAIACDLVPGAGGGEGEIVLQPREFRLLEYLMKHAGQVVTRTMLLEGVWDLHFDPQTNVIDVHMSRLRQAVDRDFDRPLIHTVRGAGYMVRAD